VAKDCAIKTGAQNVQSKDHSDNWGRKSGQDPGQDPNGFEPFANGHAKILTGGTQEASAEVVSDQ
jgi:hypothetical protein